MLQNKVLTRGQLVADIGGTNARFAYVTADSDTLQGVKKFACERFPRCIDAIGEYMAAYPQISIERICLAVAGPVEQDYIDLPNNHWVISRAALSRDLGVPVTIINDFSAQVLSIAGLSDAQLHWLGDARPDANQRQPIAVLGAGTGLGVAAMTPAGYILPSEGGHVGFAPSNQHQADILAVLWRRYDRVSVERLLSGMGLENLYWANAQLDGLDKALTAAGVTAGVRTGDKYCLRAVADFCAIMGAVAGDTALMIGATSGVYLSGGILPQMLDIVDGAAMRRAFNNKGRFTGMCEKIPLAIVVADDPGLTGCVRAMRISQD